MACKQGALKHNTCQRFIFFIIIFLFFVILSVSKYTDIHVQVIANLIYVCIVYNDNNILEKEACTSVDQLKCNGDVLSKKKKLTARTCGSP